MRLRARRGPTWGEHLRFLHAFRLERGLLLVQLAPVLLAIGGLLLPAHPPIWTLPAQAAAAALLLFAGFLLRGRPRTARTMAVLAVIAGAAPNAPRVLREPELLVMGSVGLWLVGHLILFEPTLGLTAASAMPSRARTARIASLMGLGAWFLEVLVLGRRSVIDMALTASALLVATLIALRWAFYERSAPWAKWILAVLTAGSWAGVWFTRDTPAFALSCLGVVPAVTVIVAPRTSDEESPLSRILENPARLLVATFLGLCAIGGILLSLPLASASGDGVGFLNGVFTSTSAVCVTGLIVLDTPHAFSTFGLVTLLMLIQVGGLGIMTFYTVALAALGRRLSLRHERAVAGAVNVEDRRQLVSSLSQVILVTAASELLGAAILATAFYFEGDPLPRAIWRGAFTSISAFCNAGFALQSDSLVPYQGDAVVLWTVALLIIIGGLSPAAVAAFPRWARGKRVRLQERLILTTTVALLVSGTFLYAALEWSVSLQNLSWLDRIHNAFFQSATLRTAGFNSVDLTVTRPATQTLMILFMFLGGSPGGTAGGIKTTTSAIVGFMVAATLRGRGHAEAFGRRIGSTTVFKAAAVITVGVLTCLVGVLAIQLTQRMELEIGVFEVVSALGTVGLSLNGTGTLDSVGKIIIMACMFAGRVGPLTLFLFLAEQQHESPVIYPEEEVDVG